MKKKINTQEVLELIKQGWILKTCKNNFHGHLVWLKNPTHNGPSCVRYITHGVYKNLLKKGINPVEHKL